MASLFIKPVKSFQEIIIKEDYTWMDKNVLSKSSKTFIRREKARIRRDVYDLKEQNILIKGLYPKVV